MKITVRNYRRLKSADLEFSHIALVCGRNEAGKTSLVQAVQSALTGNPLTADEDAEGKRTKQRAKELLHQGTDRGSCEIANSNGETLMVWPKCEHTTRGNPPAATAYAAGIGNLMELAPADRLRVLREIIGGEPTLDDLTEHMKAQKIGPDTIKTVWSRVEELGWEGALSQAQAKGAEIKGRYREATGQAWGKNKAVGWRPEGWQEAWEGRKIDDFEQHAQQASRRVEELMSEEAKRGISRDSLEQQVAGIDALTKTIETGQKQLASEKETLAKIEKEAAEITVPDVLAFEDCPHCAEPVAIVRQAGSWDGDKIKPTLALPPEGMDAQQIKDARLKVAEMDAKASNARASISTLEARLRDWKRALEDAEKAKAQLAEMPEQAENPEYIAACEARDTAAAELEMARMHFRGQSLHKAIVLNAAIQKTLGDEGVRATVLGRALEKTNVSLAQVCETAGMPEVIIQGDGRITCGARPYRDLSGSLRLRMRAILQLAVAKLSNSSMMVVDVEDSTDRKHLTDLLRTITRVKLPALVVAHAEAPQIAPNIETDKARELGLEGSSFWVADGVVSRLGEHHG